MKRPERIPALALFLILTAIALAAQANVAAGGAAPGPLEREAWRLEFGNDLFIGSDNGISAGASLQWQSAAARDWGSLRGASRLQRGIGRLLTIRRDGGWVCRTGLAVSQLMQTPNDLTRRDLIREDVPYAGALTVRAGWYAYHDEAFRGFELTLGAAGPLSLAERSQKAIHRLLHLVRPQGWDNQLGNELLLNLDLTGKRKIWRAGDRSGASCDLALGGDLALGNLFTLAAASLELRAGHNLPGGFVPLPDPVGFSMIQAAVLDPARPPSASVHGFLVLRGMALARMLFLDGNTFRASHSVERRLFAAVLAAGLNLDFRRWGAGFYLMSSTPLVKGSLAPGAERRVSLAGLHVTLRI